MNRVLGYSCYVLTHIRRRRVKGFSLKVLTMFPWLMLELFNFSLDPVRYQVFERAANKDSNFYFKIHAEASFVSFWRMVDTRTLLMIENSEVETGEVAHIWSWGIMEKKDYCVNRGLEILEETGSIYRVYFRELKAIQVQMLPEN